MLDAILRMLMNHYFRKRLEGFSHRNDLGKHVRTFAIFINHSLNRSDLPSDLAKTDLKRPFFSRRMNVGVLCHGPSLPRPACEKKLQFKLGSKGYGGILLILTSRRASGTVDWCCENHISKPKIKNL